MKIFFLFCDLFIAITLFFTSLNPTPIYYEYYNIYLVCLLIILLSNVIDLFNDNYKT